MPAIFDCLNNTETGPRLARLGITDDKLVRYIISRANNVSRDAALILLTGRGLSEDDLNFVREIVEQFPL